MRWWIALAVVASCQSSSKQAPPPPAPVKSIDAGVAVDHAYVIDSSGLVEVSPTSAQVIVKGSLAWCDADARANVVWYESDAGVFAYDLSSRASIPIIKGDLEEVAPIIDWGNQQLGGENKLDFKVGVAIHMGSASIDMAMGCEGDAAVYCFEDDGKTPTKEVAELQQLAKHTALVDPAAIAKLAARGASRSLWSPVPRAGSASTPKIDKARCSEIPDDCGTALPIPGSTLWLVTTANSRGDYFHQTRELFDPATGEFVAATDGGIARSKQPARDDEHTTDYAGLRSSPTGLSFEGYVFDPHRVIYTPRDFGKSCGWASGGWRIKSGAE